MADDGIFTTNAQIAVFAGTNVNTTAITTTETDKYVLIEEANLNKAVRFNFSDAFTAGLNADVASAITGYTARKCAINAINFDLNAFGVSTAQTMIDVLLDQANKILGDLKQIEVQDFISGA